ncbi:unnamed protein product, partial [Ectocarpus sp. 12 AP-2014]
QVARTSRGDGQRLRLPPAPFRRRGFQPYRRPDRRRGRNSPPHFALRQLRRRGGCYISTYQRCHLLGKTGTRSNAQADDSRPPRHGDACPGWRWTACLTREDGWLRRRDHGNLFVWSAHITQRAEQCPRWYRRLLSG